jgi:ABC-type transporter Mla subunit MlaD
MERRFHVIYKEYFVGAFLIVATMALVALIFATLAKRDVFSDRYTLRAVFNNKSDIKAGAKIKIRGMKVGQVKDIYFNPDKKIELLLNIQAKYQDMIRANSVATIFQERFPISDRIISISVGTEDHPILEDNMHIKTEEMLILSVVMDKVIRAFDDLSQIVVKIKNGEGTLGALLNRDDLYHNLNTMSSKGILALNRSNRLLTQLNAIAGKAEEMVDTLSPKVRAAGQSLDEVPRIIESVQALLDSATYLIGKINTFTSGLPGVLGKGEDLLDDADDVVGAVKDMWPVRGKIKGQTEDPPLFIDKE